MSLVQNTAALNASWDKQNLLNTESIDASVNQSIRSYSSNQEYLFAMREDLAEWLKGLYAIDINIDNFFDILATGTILCQHANNITNCAEYMQKRNGNIQWKYSSKVPSKYLNFQQIKNSKISSFFSRDNVANFIDWCRNELGIHENLMFETNDLVLKKGEKNFILCLLEVARRGSKVGVPAPVLIQMEEDIDEEIEMEKVSKEQNLPLPKKPIKQKVDCDFKSLDEMVQYILSMCTCPTRFRMVKVSDGKYKVGGSESLIFMRILRKHVMVRVGGGWDTLEQYLNKHDPCRCDVHKSERKITPRHSRSANPNRNTITRERSPVYNRSVNKGPADGVERRSQTFGRPSRNTKTSSETSPIRRVPRISNTPTPESRPSTTKHSPPFSGEKRGRSSTSKKDNQLNVFSRLTRPKSTPPVTRNTIALQDESMLVVKRSQKGTHQLERPSTKQNPTRHTVVDKPRSKPKESSDLRSKSMVVPPSNRHDRTPSRDTFSNRHDRTPSRDTFSNRHDRTPSRDTFSNRHDRTPSRDPGQTRSRDTLTSRGSIGYRTSKNVGNKDKTSNALSMSPRKSKLVKEPLYEEIDAAREREMLAALERELIENQYTLEKRRNRSRAASFDDLLESRSACSFGNSEDNEVAFHMQEDLEKVPSHPPSSYNSLPRPRKDNKSSQHERRTRIPTPVSFNNRQLLNPHNNIEANGDSSSNHSVTDSPNKSSLKNIDGNTALDQNSSIAYFDDVNSSLDRSDRFNASSDSMRFENEIKSFPKRSYQESKHLDAALLHSSAHAENSDRSSRTPSAFIPVEINSRFDVDVDRHQVYSPERLASNRSRYASYSTPDRPQNPPQNTRTPSVPDHILASCNLTSTPQFSNDISQTTPTSRVNNLFLDSREPQWV